MSRTRVTVGLLRAAGPVHGHRTVRDRTRILLCDAESQSLHALRVVLHDAGFEVDATRTAVKALERRSPKPRSTEPKVRGSNPLGRA